MDITKRREELEARHTEEKRSLETQLELLQAIPESFAHLDWFAHASKLYDRRGSLHAKYQRYSSIQKHKQPSLDDVRAFALAFPVEPITLYRDSCVGIRTRANANAVLDTMPEDRADHVVLTHLAPVWMEVHPAGYSQEFTIQWIARITGRLVDVHFEFSSYGLEARALGSLRVEYEYADRRHNHVSSVKRNEFSIAQPMHVFGDCKAGQICYSSGSRTTPGHHLIYWEDHSGNVTDITIGQIVDKLASLIPEKS